MFAFKRTYEHFAPDKVVTMLQKRNQVFERVICADVLGAMQFGGAGLVFAGYLRTFPSLDVPKPVSHFRLLAGSGTRDAQLEGQVESRPLPKQNSDVIESEARTTLTCHHKRPTPSTCINQ